jgi:hypothetical protein
MATHENPDMTDFDNVSEQSSIYEEVSALATGVFDSSSKQPLSNFLTSLYFKTFVTNHYENDYFPCYLIDKRWTLINNIFLLSKNLNNQQELISSNMLVYKDTLHVEITNETLLTTKSNVLKSLAILCLEILCFKFLKREALLELINPILDNKENLYNLFSYCYPDCSIHKKIYYTFCDEFLFPCFKGQPITMDTWTIFFNTHFNREENFYIKGEGQSMVYYIDGILYNRVFEHIITHSFPNKNIYIINNKSVDQVEYVEIITRQMVELHNPQPSLIIRGPFYYTGTNCHSAYDFEKITINQDLISKSNLCIPSNPYQDDKPYNVPYISFSIEPLRARLNPYQLPLLEINTISKDKRTTKNVLPYDSRLYKNVMWWGKQLSYFDNTDLINQYWIPYMVHYYCDSIKFNEEDKPFKVINSIPLSEKKIDFIFIAKNCSSEIRNSLFLKLQDMDPNKDKDISKKRVRSYGSCLNNSGKNASGHFIRHPKDDAMCNSGLHNISTGNWSQLNCAYSESKFTFAIENVLFPGYISEKIIIAFQGGSIPIYYGPEEILDYFNEDAFYYVNRRLSDPYNPLETEIKLIANELWELANDNESTGWKKYHDVPIFKNNKTPDLFKYKTSDWMEKLVNKFKTKYDQQLRIKQDDSESKVTEINLSSLGKYVRKGKKSRKTKTRKGKKSRKTKTPKKNNKVRNKSRKNKK